MRTVGLSTCGFPLTKENFAALKAAGIDAVEISMPWDQYADIDYAAVQRYAEKYGIQLWSFHLPFCPFEQVDISSPDEALRQGTIAYYTTLIEKATAIGIKTFIVHPSGEPIADDRREQHVKQAMHSLDELAEIAAGHGAVIAVEDLPRTCLGNTSEELLRLIGVNDALRICFDTNHLLGEDPVHFVHAVGDKIVTTHVSDYDFLDERHWLPGEGNVDWHALLDALDEAGYHGMWLYELGLEAPNVTRPRKLTFADFRRNADELFERKTPTVIA